MKKKKFDEKISIQDVRFLGFFWHRQCRRESRAWPKAAEPTIRPFVWSNSKRTTVRYTKKIFLINPSPLPKGHSPATRSKKKKKKEKKEKKRKKKKSDLL